MSYWGPFCKPKDPVRVIFVRRAWYEMVLVSIPVFIASGLNNLVASIISMSSEESEDHEAADIGQQCFYTFFLSYLFGKYLYYLLAAYIISCRESNSSDAYDPFHFFAYCKDAKCLTLLARILNENASFSIKEFMLLILLEKTYEEHGFGWSFGGLILAFVFFVIVTLTFIVIFKSIFKMEVKLLEWLIEYDLDSFALGVGAIFIAIAAKGLSEEGFKFISNNSIIYGHTGSEGDDDNLHGAASSYNFIFTFGMTLWCGILLLLEDIARGNDIKKEIDDKFESTLAIIPVKKTCGDIENTTEGRSDHPHHHHHHHSIWELFKEAVVEYYHAILGCICGVALFVFLTDNVLGWVAVGFNSSAAANFVAILILAMYASSRSPYCIVSSHSKAKANVNTIKANREYLQEAKASTGSYKAANCNQDSASTGTEYVRDTQQDVISPDNDSTTAETPSWCEKRFGRNVAICWSGTMDYYYRVILHRRRLFLIALKLAVGWTWEVVVSAFFNMVTESIELTPGELIGVRVAIMIVIVILSATVFYFFKDEQDLFAMDPYEEAERLTEMQETSNQSSINPMSANTSATNNNMER